MSSKVNSVAEIRSSFLEYFQSKKHFIEKSASLLPGEDPTLLFTTAGMVPFKDYFSGLIKPPSPRMATVQKCFRTTDLANVGKTKRHLSFFEMLGNFSFADYFKKEAIEFAWEYVTTFLPFEKDRIWVSIYLDDDEAFQIWNKHIGVPANKIVRLGKSDNFWGPAGSTGACGPCSELYLDRGKEYSCFSDDCKPGDEGERFMEFWNLVFNQFDLKENGEYQPLKNTGIDTGAGLERLATLVQGVDSVYDTNELANIRKAIEKVYNVPYEKENIDPIRVLTDHVRALSFTMADGIYPSNESRGYVLRRLLRRALLFGRKLGQREPKLYNLVPVVAETYGYFYPELNSSVQLITDYIKSEELRFLQTLEIGNEKINEILIKAKEGKYANGIISGKEVFTLYDTFGFPPEMTQEIAENEGFKIDMQGFSEEMEKQRIRGKSAWKGDVEAIKDLKTQTIFCGYEEDSTENSTITELLSGNETKQTIKANDLNGNVFYLITSETPCYAESGGQLGDTGFIHGKSFNCKIVDTQKQGNTIYHICDSLEGEISLGDKVSIQIDIDRRNLLKRNHSATHLLNAALRKKLGQHIKQSGSLVSPDYLRFDFTHPNRLEKAEIEEIEKNVNLAINSKYEVTTDVLSKGDAEKTGALMNFGEKYGETVRVVKMNDYSKEFCGGTHVKNSSEIGLFLITKEFSPGAGNRRIEALCSDNAFKKILETENNLLKQIHEEGSQVSEKYKNDFQLTGSEITKETAKPEKEKFSVEHWQILNHLEAKALELFANNKKALKKDSVKTDMDEDLLNEFIHKKQIVNGHGIISGKVTGNIAQMKSMMDYLRSKEPESIAVLISTENQKWNLTLGTTHSYAEKNNIDLSKTIKKLLSDFPEFNGGGGGKKELVQGSGTFSPEALPDAYKTLLEKTIECIKA